MRIGMNASFLRKPGTGIGQVTLYFLKTLAQTDAGREHEYFLYLEEDIDISFLPENFKKIVCLPFWKRDDIFRKWLWENKTLLERTKEDKIESFLSLYQSATVLSDTILHTMVVHDLVPRLFPEYRANFRQQFYWGAVEWAIKKCIRIVAVSQSTADDLVEFGIERSKITIASPDSAPLFNKPVSEDESQRVMKKYSLESGYIYHGGGLEIRKNTEQLLRSYAGLVARERNGQIGAALPPLVISGKIFPKSNKLAVNVEELVVELGLEGRVRFLGFVPDEDLPPLYKNALYFVYPSLYEGFGLPVLEALHIGTPVLVSDCSSLPEVAGDAALYIDPLMEESLQSGMEKLLLDVPLRNMLHEKSKEQVKKFDWKIFSMTLIHSFKK